MMPDKMLSSELQPNVKATMQQLGRAIGEACPPGTGFALLMFDFGGVGFMNWLSNAQRGDMIPALKEMLYKLEGAGC